MPIGACLSTFGIGADRRSHGRGPGANFPIGQKRETNQLPPITQAFCMRVEAPPIYPSEAVVDIQREAHRLGRELLSRLGYHVPKRMRKSTSQTAAAIGPMISQIFFLLPN